MWEVSDNKDTLIAIEKGKPRYVLYIVEIAKYTLFVHSFIIMIWIAALPNAPTKSNTTPKNCENTGFIIILFSLITQKVKFVVVVDSLMLIELFICWKINEGLILIRHQQWSKLAQKEGKCWTFLLEISCQYCHP